MEKKKMEKKKKDFSVTFSLSVKAVNDFKESCFRGFRGLLEGFAGAGCALLHVLDIPKVDVARRNRKSLDDNSDPCQPVVNRLTTKDDPGG